MFVRWKKRNLRKGPDFSLVAALVVSKRGERSKREITKYMGSIRSSHIGILGVRIAFWERVGQILDGLSLPPGFRRSIECELDEKVRKPTEEEKERYRIRADEVRQMLRELAQKHRSSSRYSRTTM